jgi:hypothetical protein
MTILADLNNTMNQSIEADNFAEEVTVIAENKSGQNFSLYTVKNKNNITFQKVPGGAGIERKGVLGFINGDKTRPALIGVTAPTTNAISIVSNPGWPVADIS